MAVHAQAKVAIIRANVLAQCVSEAHFSRRCEACGDRPFNIIVTTLDEVDEVAASVARVVSLKFSIPSEGDVRPLGLVVLACARACAT